MFTTRATAADLDALPDNAVGEIIDGKLITSSLLAPRGANAKGAICADLRSSIGWWVLMKQELHLGADILVADIAGWTLERLPVLPDGPGVPVVPNWVCEVLSPATERLDRTRKRTLYGERGVDHLWLVDPVQRMVEVYRRQQARWLLVGVHGDDEKVRISPFDSIELDLSCWWLPGSASNGG